MGGRRLAAGSGWGRHAVPAPADQPAGCVKAHGRGHPQCHPKGTRTMAMATSHKGIAANQCLERSANQRLERIWSSSDAETCRTVGASPPT
jgi:hypothetical protein